MPYAVDKGARILPVNYVVNNDSIIFRTVPGGEIGGTTNVDATAVQ